MKVKCGYESLRRKLKIRLVGWLIIPVCAVNLFAQQPAAPSTARPTGRSYSEGDERAKPIVKAARGVSPVQFTDITARSGINFRHHASPTSQKYLLETMGGGVALFDYDNDGRLDMYFTNGAQLQEQMSANARPDKTDARFWNRLYHQKPDGTFEDVTERAGVRGSGYAMGAAAGDYDNDGLTDLYVTAYGGNALYRNRGDGTFEDVTRRTNTAGGGWSTSAGWLDYDRDGRLDLFVARYMDWDFQNGSLYCGLMKPGFRAFCHPDNFKGAGNLLFHQKPDGTFEDVSLKAGVADAEGKGLGLAFADFNDDGWTDIIVANDSVRQSLYMNRGDGTFDDVALPAGVGFDENGKTFAGMGVDAADYDADGRADIIITALSNETYPLFRNNGDDSFSYTTNTTGVGQITLLLTGWGVRFADFDLDGMRDIFVAQGHVLDTIEKSSSYLLYKQPPLLMRNVGKTFLDVSASAGFTVPLAARGCAFGDIDNDGDTDIVIGTTNDAPVMFRNMFSNDAGKNHWIGFNLVGTKSNRAGIGTRVTITDSNGRRQTADANTAGSYLASNDGRIVFGLGATAKVASVEVRWSTGKTQKVMNPIIDQYQIVKEE
ncbi:MAG: CRTAC1 family protein [Pyrinomonadaceae bacterium MAG19_C2-C3]|nr:CRTAC1 family protein [Pyrinomonadaceae bacterium MAG19_C2-C3]